MYVLCVLSDLTCPHTPVLDKIMGGVREVDKWGSSSIVYSRIIMTDLFQENFCGKRGNWISEVAVKWGLTALSHCTVSLYRLTVLSHCTVSLYCLTVLSHCTVSVYCLTVPSHCTVSVYCLTVLSHCTVSLYCLTVQYILLLWVMPYMCLYSSALLGLTLLDNRFEKVSFHKYSSNFLCVCHHVPKYDTRIARLTFVIIRVACDVGAKASVFIQFW